MGTVGSGEDGGRECESSDQGEEGRREGGREGVRGREGGSEREGGREGGRGREGEGWDAEYAINPGRGGR